MLDFCAEHGLGAEIELIGVDQINEAYERVVASDVRYRFVIDTASFDGSRVPAALVVVRIRHGVRVPVGDLPLPALAPVDLGRTEDV